MTMIHQQLAVAAQGAGREYQMVSGINGYSAGNYGSLTPDDWKTATIENLTIPGSLDRFTVAMTGAGDQGALFFGFIRVSGSGLDEYLQAGDATYSYNPLTDAMVWNFFAPSYTGWQFADGSSYTITLSGGTPFVPPPSNIYELDAGTSGGSWRGCKTVAGGGPWGSLDPSDYNGAAIDVIESNVGSFVYHVNMAGNRAQDFFEQMAFDNGVTLVSANASSYTPTAQSTDWFFNTPGPSMQTGQVYEIVIT